jgi:uncharacterized membrane protein (UPF0182 family)
MEETLRLGLAQIFGPTVMTALAPDRLEGAGLAAPLAPVPGGPAPAAAPASARPQDPAVDALLGEIQAHYDRMIAAQKAGDWARYGEEQKALGAVLEKIDAARRRN